MKCNKCLKKIPKGEEIRFTSNDSSWRGDGGGYSGCYCEDCWKNSEYYRDHEDGGKQKPIKSNKNDGMPAWFWFIMGMLIGVVITIIIASMMAKDKD